MDLIYCYKCGKKIPPGGLDEGKRFLVNGEPVCPKCYAQRPAAEQTGNTVMATDPVPARRPTSQISIPAAKRPSSRLIPAVPAEHRPSQRLFREHSRVAVLWLVGAAAILLVAAIAVAMAFRSSSEPTAVEPVPGTRVGPGPVTSPDPAHPSNPANPPAKSDKALAQARAYWQEHPEDYSGAIAKFQAAASVAAGSQWAKDAEAGVAEVQTARAAAVEKYLAGLGERAAQAVSSGDYDKAMTILDEPPPAAIEVQVREQVKAAKAQLHKEATGKLQAAMEGAERLSKDKQPEKGLEELDKVKAIKLAAWTEKLAVLRARLVREAGDEATKAERQKAAEARARAEQVLDRFAKTVIEGSRNYAAEALLNDKKNLDKDALAVLPGDLAAAERVASRLLAMETARQQAIRKLAGQDVVLRLRGGQSVKGQVEEVTEAGFKVREVIKGTEVDGRLLHSVSFSELAGGELIRLAPPPEPKDADDQVAAALVRMAEADADGAGRALKAAGDHPLAARLSKPIAEAAVRVREAAAERFWTERLGRAIKDQYSDFEAEGLLANLNAFVRDHGETAFAKGKGADVEKLRPILAYRPAAIQALFKGKVVSFDPATMEAELHWDFTSPAQLEDFTVGGKPIVSKGALTLKTSDSLWSPAAFGSRLKLTCDATCAVKGHLDIVIGSSLESVALCRDVKNAASLWKKTTLGGPVQVGTQTTMEAACSDGTYSARAGGKQVHKPVPLAGTPLAFALAVYGDGTAVFRNLRAVGKLDRTWLDGALLERKAAQSGLVYTQWPCDAAEARRRQVETAEKLDLPLERSLDLPGGVKLEMVLIPAGEFTMGGELSPQDLDRKDPGQKAEVWEREGPRHRVRLPRPFYIGKYAVTQEQWEKVTGKNPSEFKGARHPVERVSWDDAQDFLKKLNAAASGRPPLRLPTEAEREYACRAGTDTPFFFGDAITPDQANYNGELPWDGRKGANRGKTAPVGSFPANAWGLFDMAGNVWEWCSDWYGPYSQDAQSYPRGPAAGTERVLRGGSWSNGSPGRCRSAARECRAPKSSNSDTGLRLVMPAR